MSKLTNKFSCADFTFPLLPHDKVLALLRLLGMEGVDLGVFVDRSHVQPKDIVGNVPAAVKKMRASLAANGLVASDVFLQTGAEPPVRAANNPDTAVRNANREMFRRVLEFCAGLDCKHLTGLPGVWHANADKAADWQRAIEEARWRMDTARAAGVTYAIEPHVGSMLPDPESALRFVSDCAGLTLTLDYGHFIYQGMTNESVHPLVPHASHFHARGGANGQLQSTVKENVIDFPEILRRLRAANYAGWFCLEYVWVDWEGCNRTDNVSETLLLRDLLRGLEACK
ncbi:MAG: sugar phosphate isomerase/epimerase [Verrucomicrobia bacterium]|nr:sugar phosphate isomerase/epimerase [Verrucomicrobiota bacterium]